MTIEEMRGFLIEDWGKSGVEIINYIATIPQFNGTFDDFLKFCTPCGGNWGGMLLTGIKTHNEHLWNLIPDDMGTNAFTDICLILRLWGVDFK